MKSKLEIVINQKDKKRIIYKVVEEQGNRCILSGINYRVKLDVEKKYLEEASIDLIKKEEKEKDKYYLHTKFRRGNKKNLLGTVLHIDTDEEYLNKCVDLYESIGIYVYPVLCDEKDISYNIRNKELDFIPDVIVITGHDYFYGHNKKDIEDITANDITECNIAVLLKGCHAGGCQFRKRCSAGNKRQRDKRIIHTKRTSHCHRIFHKQVTTHNQHRQSAYHLRNSPPKRS